MLSGEELDRALERSARQLGIRPHDWTTAKAFLAPLKYKNEVTHYHYEHTARVGLLSRQIGKFVHLEQKPLFLAGLLHDLGKCQIPTETLGKTDTWTPADYARIRRHVSNSYALLRDRFDFTAEVIIWHHRFQRDGYPKRLPRLLHAYSEATKLLIIEYGRMVAIADVYDALHRANSKFGDKRVLSGEEIREKMFQFNPDRKKLIEDLYRKRILTV